MRQRTSHGGTHDKPHVVTVGRFTFDERTLELFDGEQPIKLQPKPTLVLAELIAARGALVGRDRLYEVAWGDTVVEFDLALNRCIRDIRAAVGDDAKSPTFIATVPRRGYRLVAPIARVRPTDRTALWRFATIAAAVVVALLLAPAVWAPDGGLREHDSTILSFHSFGASVAGLDQAIQGEVSRRLRLGTATPQSSGLLVNGVIVPATDGALLEVTIVRLADGQPIWSGRYNPLCERIIGDPTALIGELISREAMRRS